MKILTGRFSEEEMAVLRGIAPDADFVRPTTDEDLFRDVDDDGSPTLDPDVKVQSYVLEESVIEDEYIPIPEEDESDLEIADL